MANRTDRLTRKETDVLQLIAAGMSNEEIAERLSMSVRGVEQHLTNIYGKLGVRSRTEAVIAAARKGLVVFEAENP